MNGRRQVGFGVFIIAACALGVAPPAQAQQLPTFRSGIELIEVDATVIDGDGNPIPDLQAADFSVTVEGEPRAVVQAQFISLRAAEGDSLPVDSLGADAGYTTNAGADPGRLIVILVDEESIPWGEGRHVMRAAAEFVDSLSPGDRVSVVAMPQPGVYIDFTSDHDRVRHAVAGMSGLGIPPQNNGFIEYEVLQERRRRSETTRHGIETILETMQGVEGPKALVWISGGFVIAGAELGLERMAELAAASRTTLYIFMLDEPLADTSVALSSGQPDAFVVEQAPPAEDYGLQLDPASRRLQEQGLMAAASMTGGSLLRAFYNPGPLFDRLERELSGYYLLGVEMLPSDRDGEFHEIDVSVRRDGARVRSHRGVHVPPEGAGPSEEERILRLLRAPVPVRELPLRVATYAYRGAAGDGGGMAILVGAEFDAAGSVPEALSMGYLLRDSEGAVASHATVQVVPNLVQKADGPVFEVDFMVRAEQLGDYSLQLAAIDAAGRRGSVEHPVRADRMSGGPLSAGDLMLADWTLAPAGEIPTRVEAQVSSGRLLAFTELYADSPAPWDRTRVEVDVLDGADGSILAWGQARLEGSGGNRRSATAVVEVHDLPPGRYVALARVLQDATEVADVSRPFRIVSQPVP